MPVVNWVNLIAWILIPLAVVYVLRYLVTSTFIFWFVQIVILVAALLWFLRERDYEPLIALLLAFSVFQAANMASKKAEPTDNESKTRDGKQNLITISDSALEITAWKAHKQENWIKGEPLKQWVLMFVITNQGGEPVFFERIQIIFVFREPWPPISKRIIDDAFGIDRWLRCGLYLDQPEPDFSLKGMQRKIKIDHDWLHIPHNIALFNWETRETINISPFKTYRSPEPGGKEIWCLHGKFPQEIAKQILKSELYLNSIETIFHTDKGRNAVTGSFNVLEALPAELEQKLQ